MITVVSTCYKRFENYEKVLEAWLNEENVNEVIVLDNSGTFKTNLPVTVFSVNKNLGPQAKYPIALQAKNEIIIFADDDILIDKGLTDDFLKYWKGTDILGVIGRVFTGKNYYESKGYRGENISELTKVEWLGGGCTMVRRDICGVFPSKCPAPELDDIWWESHFHNRLNMYVIPTTKYHFLPESTDENALYLNDKIKDLREEYSKKWGFQH